MFRFTVCFVAIAACLCTSAFASGYGSSAPSYEAPAPSYEAPAPSYEAPAPSYSAPAPSYEAPAPSYSAPAPSYGAPSYGSSGPAAAPQVISLPANVEAQAAALTNAAGAKATAAKINAINWDLLNLYGYEIGYPLLVKNHGPLTSLYAATLPPRSFVGQIDPAFLKDSYGKIKYVGESTIGVAAI